MLENLPTQKIIIGNEIISGNHLPSLGHFINKNVDYSTVNLTLGNS